PPVSPPAPPARSPGGKGRALVWVGTALAVLVIGGLVGGIFFLKGGRRGRATGNQDLGVIEVGSKGVRGLVVEFFRTDDGHDWKVKNKSDRQIDLGKLTSTNQHFRPEALEDLKKALTELSE